MQNVKKLIRYLGIKCYLSDFDGNGTVWKAITIKSLIKLKIFQKAGKCFRKTATGEFKIFHYLFFLSKLPNIIN